MVLTIISDHLSCDIQALHFINNAVLNFFGHLLDNNHFLNKLMVVFCIKISKVIQFIIINFVFHVCFTESSPTDNIQISCIIFFPPDKEWVFIVYLCILQQAKELIDTYYLLVGFWPVWVVD